MTLGNGKTATFWRCPWANAVPLCVSFPRLFRHSRRKHRTVAEALTNETWIKDLAHGDTTGLLHDFLTLARRLQDLNIILQQDTEDTIRWKFSADGKYSAASAYKMQFQGHTKTTNDMIIWKAWAPGQLKVFLWLLFQNKLWCNDRLQRRGWTNGYFCQLCIKNLETSLHLFWHCDAAKRIWNTVAQWCGCESFAEDVWRSSSSHSEIVTCIISKARAPLRKAVQSLAMITLWRIWRERNECVFRNKVASVPDIIDTVQRDLQLWRQAGAKALVDPFGKPP